MNQQDHNREEQEVQHLQHEAEHARPHKKVSVMGYLTILFAAAFLLLLLSYFMQQRANEQAISGLQATSNNAFDSINNLIAEKDELESKIRGDIKAQTEAWHEIEDVLDTLTKSDEKAVIRVRYHDRESWSAVSKILFGKRIDFSEKTDSYLRRVHKLHGSALVNLAKAVEVLSHT